MMPTWVRAPLIFTNGNPAIMVLASNSVSIDPKITCRRFRHASIGRRLRRLVETEAGPSEMRRDEDQLLASVRIALLVRLQVLRNRVGFIERIELRGVGRRPLKPCVETLVPDSGRDSAFDGAQES